MRPPLGGYISPYDISADGSTIVGTAAPIDGSSTWHGGYRWTSENGILAFPPYPPFPWESASEAVGTSDDGSVIVGNGGPVGSSGFCWTAKAGFVPLPCCGFASAVSGDGSVVAGAFGVQSRIWRLPASPILHGNMPGGTGAVPAAISHDGTTVVGRGDSQRALNNQTEAFRWTQQTGMVGLGDLPGGVFDSRALAVSGDGSIVVGTSLTASSTLYDAFIWDVGHGMRSLTDVVQNELSLDLGGVGLQEADAISCDGRTIACWCVLPDESSGMCLIYLGRPCPADWNNDGLINSQDFFDYITDFFRSRPVADPNRDADMDGDGDADSADFFNYLATFLAGCP